MTQRRLAAIVFTDIVGFTAMSQRNESLALELLELHRDILRSVFQKYRGTEIKTIGDAFLIEFSNALDAVHAALGMQKALSSYNRTCEAGRQIQIRIGVHIGDIEERGDDIYGDGVNIASRIEPLAPSGGICISEPVYTLVHNKIDTQFFVLENTKLKNISQKLTLYIDSKPSVVQGVARKITRSGVPALLSSAAIFIVLVGYFLSGEQDIDSSELDFLPSSQLTIAVLPFAAADSAIPTIEAQLAASEIAALLANNRSISVISPEVIESMGLEDFSPGNILSRLPADQVLSGTFRVEAGRSSLGIEVRNSEGLLWRESFLLGTSLLDQAHLHRQISRQVQELNSIQTASSGECGPANNFQSMALYHRAVNSLHNRTRPEIDSAITALTQAIELDSSYAQALEGLALAYFILPSYLPPAERREAIAIYNPLSEDAAKLALQNCQNLGLATFLSGTTARNLENVYIDLELRFLEALNQSPNDLWLLDQYGSNLLAQVGRTEYSVAVLERAYNNHPNQARAIESLAIGHIASGDIALALQFVELLEATETESCNTTIIRTTASLILQDSAAMLEILETAPQRCLNIGYTEMSNQLLEAQENAELRTQMLESGRDAMTTEAERATLIAIWLGDVDLAFEAIGIARERGQSLNQSLWWLESSNVSLFRQDPRFPELLESLGILEYWQQFGFSPLCSPTEGLVRCQ